MPNNTEPGPQTVWLDLSLAQQAIWLDAKISGESLYQLGGWVRVAGHLDAAAVRQSISLIMARHDALRLRVDDQKPRQWLSASVEPPCSVLQLDPPPGVSPDDAFHTHANAWFQSPLPWGDHPLFRMQLVFIGSNLSYLLWRFHHLLADSNSTTITIRHWAEAYLALTSDEPPQLAPRSSYLAIVDSDTQYLKSPVYQQDLAYWQSRFDPLPPVLIPATSPQAVATGSGTFYLDWTLDPATAGTLAVAARAIDVTPQRALFALFLVVLARRFHQTDLVAGIAIHRRDRSNQNLLGLLSGVLPVRTRLQHSSTLCEVLQRYSAQVDADLRHQRMPVDKLSRALNLFRTGRARLYEVVLSYIPAVDQQEPTLDGLALSSGVMALPEASPISLHITELPQQRGFAVRLCINPSIVESAQLPALLATFQSLLATFLQAPNRRIAELPPEPESRSSPAIETEDWTI
jgi:hypothetical protein